MESARRTVGGTKRNRLFMAASQSLYAVYTGTQGAAPGSLLRARGRTRRRQPRSLPTSSDVHLEQRIAERLAVRVEPERGRDAAAQRSFAHELQRPQTG